MFEVLQRCSQPNTTIMETYIKHCQNYLFLINIGTELFADQIDEDITMHQWRVTETHGEVFGKVFKKNKTTAWIKLNDGRIIKNVFISQINKFIKK